MIICPNCNAENADNANHCGNCGDLLTKGSGQKTMFGFAAVTPEAIQQAAADAKAASAAAKPSLGGLPKPSIPSPGGQLPKPGLPSPGGLGSPAGLGGLPKPNIPGLAPPSEVSEATGDAIKTEMIAAVPAPGFAAEGAEFQQNFGAPEVNPFDETAANTFEDAAMAMAATAPPGESNLRPPEASDGFGSPADNFGAPAAGFGAPADDFGAPAAGFGAPPAAGFGEPLPPASGLDAPETQPELSVPAGLAGSEPNAFNASMPQSSPDNPMQASGFGGGGGSGGFVRGEVKNPIMVLVLIMVTCGLYGFIWFFQFFKDLNGGLGEERFVPVKEFLLTMVTCGIWGMWLWWRSSEAIVEVQEKWGVKPMMDAPIIFLIMIMGFGPFVMQAGLNNAWENGNPPA